MDNKELHFAQYQFGSYSYDMLSSMNIGAQAKHTLGLHTQKPLHILLFIALLAHDHQRCLDLLLLLLHFPHHLQHGVHWRTTLFWPGEEVEQGHFMGEPRALERQSYLCHCCAKYRCDYQFSCDEKIQLNSPCSCQQPAKQSSPSQAWKWC